MGFTDSYACRSRVHCQTCRSDESWRKKLRAPADCPHGVTLDSLPSRQVKGAIRKPQPKRTPCAHLGKLTGAQTPCKTCGGKKLEAVHSCAVLGSCTISRRSSDPTIACCVGCGKWEAIGDVSVKREMTIGEAMEASYQAERQNQGVPMISGCCDSALQYGQEQ